MKRHICAIRDRATDTYGQPVFVVAKGEAIRSFGDEVNNAQSGNQLNAHPEDFDLYYLGTFDSLKGTFETCVPEQLAVGKDMVRS